MSILPVDGAPENHRVVEPPAPIVDVPSYAEAVAPPAPTEDQVWAVDGAFLRQHQEQQTVEGLLSLRMSLLLMHDLAKEAAPPDEEEIPRKAEGDADPPEGA